MKIPDNKQDIQAKNFQVAEKNSFYIIILNTEYQMGLKEMTLEEAIYGRRSVRKFKATSVSDEIIKDLNSGKI